jgi:hypothetical protein
MKTSELTGAALDWAVTKLEAERKRFVIYPQIIGQYSTNWAQGGPIIERENITIAYGEEEADWFACVGDSRRFDDDTPDGLAKLVGHTPLIAAMRCYVASKLGDDIEIPEELK